MRFFFIQRISKKHLTHFKQERAGYFHLGKWVSLVLKWGGVLLQVVNVKKKQFRIIIKKRILYLFLGFVVAFLIAQQAQKKHPIKLDAFFCAIDNCATKFLSTICKILFATLGHFEVVAPNGFLQGNTKICFLFLVIVLLEMPLAIVQQAL